MHYGKSFDTFQDSLVVNSPENDNKETKISNDN